MRKTLRWERTTVIMGLKLGRAVLKLGKSSLIKKKNKQKQTLELELCLNASSAT